MNGEFRVRALGVSFVCGIAGSAVAADRAPLCFIPGMDGGKEYVMRDLPRELEPLGISFISFAVGGRGRVQVRAQRFVHLFERQLEQDPNFHCHIVAHSMGGIVARYALNHLTVNHPMFGVTPLRNYIDSVTTFSSPHRGTPLAGLLNRFAPHWDHGLDQLSEENIVMFNDPAYPETYSPAVPGIPFYSYRTYLQSASEAGGLFAKIGFSMLWNMLKDKRREPWSDSVIPLSAQGFGTVLADLHKPHAYFGTKTDLNPPLPVFYERYARFLYGEGDPPLTQGAGRPSFDRR